MWCIAEHVDVRGHCRWGSTNSSIGMGEVVRLSWPRVGELPCVCRVSPLASRTYQAALVLVHRGIWLHAGSNICSCEIEDCSRTGVWDRLPHCARVRFSCPVVSS